MRSSKANVTQQDPVANPQKDGAVKHIHPLRALHDSLRSDHYRDLSTGARALYTWICLNSQDFGFAWRRLDALAKELGIHRRILCMKRRELEDAALIRTEYVQRGQRLPNGKRMRHQTATFWVLKVPKVGAQSAPIREPEFTAINDPTMIIHDPHDHGSPRQTLFCDLLLEEEGGRPPGPPAPPNPPDEEPPSTHENPFASIATDLLQRWKERLAPTFRLYEDPETYLEAHALVIARLQDGVTKTRALAAIEAHVESPHNQAWERRTIHHVFGDTERLERMASLGISKMGMVPDEPKSETRAKTLTSSTRIERTHSREDLLDLVGRRKFEVQELWKTATAKARRSGIGLGVSAGFPAQDLALAAAQVPLEITTWLAFGAWFESAIVEWYMTGQHNPKFDATTSAFYKWLANDRRHPYVRPQDIKQGGTGDEDWWKEL